MTPQLEADLALLQRYLDATGWQGGVESLIEAVPHMAEALSHADHLATLQNLGLPLSLAGGRLQDLRPEDCPVLFLEEGGYVGAILDLRETEMLEALPDRPEPAWVPIWSERGVFVRVEPHRREPRTAAAPSLRQILAETQAGLGWLLMISGLSNLFATLTPLLVLAVYDFVIPAGDLRLVVGLAAAVALVLLSDFLLRTIRASAIAGIAADLERRLGLALFYKLSWLPLAELRKSDVDQQIGRLKQFETMRQIFSGPHFQSFLDLPFLLIFFAVIAWLNGTVALIVLGAIACFAALAVTVGPRQARLSAESIRAQTVHQKFLQETVGAQRTLCRLGAAEVWRARHRPLLDAASEATRRAQVAQQSAQVVGQLVTTLAGLLAVAVATRAAMAGETGFGALIAIMSLIWRTLGPIQALYAAIPQLSGFRNSAQQIDRVLALGEEFARGTAHSPYKSFEGRLRLQSVTLWFPMSAEPALAALSLEIPAREFVVLQGPSGAGKTALLDLLDGLHVPNAGTVQIDGVNYRQIAVDDLRRMVGYARQTPEFFHGTVVQNIRLAAPSTTEAEVRSLLDRLSLSEAVDALPDGLDTRLTEAVRRDLPRSLRTGLGILRILAKPGTSVLLLDTPEAGLDAARRAALVRVLSSLKGRMTVIVASEAPEFTDLADRLVYLSRGRVILDGGGASARRKLAMLREAEGGGYAA